MKIQINNLGPIHKYEFDLSKDMNIIFGKNNIGKSYAITAIYLIIKNLTSEGFRSLSDWSFMMYRHQYMNFGSDSKALKKADDVEKQLVDKFKAKSVSELNITNETITILTTLIEQSFVVNLEKSFETSYSLDNLSNKLSGENFSIFLTYKNFSFSIKQKNGHFHIDDFSLNEDIIMKKTSSTRKPLKSENKHVLYFNEKNKKVTLMEFVLKTFYSEFINEVIDIVGNVYFLPASRSGLYQALSTFSAVIAELSKSRNFLTNKIELPNISEPVSDYFLFLSRIQDKKANKRYSEIIEIIENEVLGGKIIFNKETKKIVFAPQKIDTELDLAFTSSMISEIAPIVAFLKYIITDAAPVPRFLSAFSNVQRKDKVISNLLFIEEPEAHLHPEVQIKLMELFSKLLNYDVKIVMTSHSNYMFNKLSNLILSQEVNYERVGSYLMKMEDKGSQIDSITMQADKEGMYDNNFADVAEQLYEERISIYDKLNDDAFRKNKK